MGSYVGWVERSETHYLAGGTNGGFRFALPTLRLAAQPMTANAMQAA
jgi:hypothetical protein